MQRLILIILIFFQAVNAHSQYYQSIIYDQEKGLQNEMVKALAVDQEGFLWLGTDYGLIRYNGKEFFDHSQLLSSNYIKALHHHSNGSLFVTYDMGFSKIEMGVDNVESTKLAEGSVKHGEGEVWYPKTMFEDKEGNLWFSDNTSVYRYNDDQLHSYELGMHNLPSSYSRSFSFFEDEIHCLMMVSQQGYFYRYDKIEDKVVPATADFDLSNVSGACCIGKNRALLGSNEGLVEIVVDEIHGVQIKSIVDANIDASSFLRENDTSIIIGSWSNGLWKAKVTDENVVVSRIEDFSINSGINQIISYNRDLFIATDNGFVLMKKKMFRPMVFESSENFIQHISYNPESESLLISTGSMVLKADYQTLSTQTIFRDDSRTFLHVVPDGNAFWISDNLGFLQKIIDGKIVKTFDLTNYGSSIYNFTLDQHGNMWVCQSGMTGIIRIDANDQINILNENQGLNSIVNVVVSSPNAEIYVGAGDSTGYLYQWLPDQERFINLSKPLSFDLNLNITINDLKFDNEGIVWLASNHGLLKLNDEKLQRINLGLLTDEDIKALTIDEKNNQWFALSDGVCMYDGENLLTFNHQDGLPSKTVSYRCLAVIPGDRIFAGTLAGVGYMKKSEEPVLTVKPELLHISDKGVLFKSTSENKFDNLSYLGFNFISTEYPTENITYKIKLIGEEDIKETFTRKSEFFVGNLQVGNYQLEIRAKQRGNSLWSQPLVYQFTIYRVWYQQVWVWVFFAVVLIALIFFIIAWKSRILKADKKKLNRLVSERTFELETKNKEIEATNIQLVRAKEEAERSSKAKAEFLSVMSHEIRTPMHGVIGMIDLLLMGNPSPPQVEQLNILRFSAGNLLMLLNDILDFNKIESGRIELEMIGFNLKEIIQNLKFGFDTSAKQKGVSIELEWDETIPQHLIGDPTRLSQILINLVGNATKFTEKGEVRIIIENHSTDNNHSVVKFKIEDTGIGIAPEKFDHIFEVFNQASSDTTRKFGGTGLGLSITKKLLELMGSKIEVKSKVGEGSTFSFMISFMIDKNHKESAITEAETTGLHETKKTINSINEQPVKSTFKSLKGLKLLLVEDNPINIKVASQLLKHWEIELDVAEDGQKALDLFTIGKYHLILMDLHLPGMDGFETTTEIRKTDPNIPIIALTAAAMVEEKEKVFQVGMNDFITKPFKLQDLYQKIVGSTHWEQKD